MEHGATFIVAHGRPMGPRIGSLKSPCMTSYWSSVEKKMSQKQLRSVAREIIPFRRFEPSRVDPN